jgi:hypothetical protein
MSLSDSNPSSDPYELTEEQKNSLRGHGLLDDGIPYIPRGRSHAGKGARGDVSMAGPVASADAEPRLPESSPSSRHRRCGTEAQERTG